MNKIVPIIKSLIVRYLTSICMGTLGQTVSIYYKHMYSTLKEDLDKLGISERSFRQYWREFLEEISDYIVYRSKQRGLTVLKREICEDLVPLTIISNVATEKFELESQLERLYRVRIGYNIVTRKIVCSRLCDVHVDDRDDISVY